MSFYYGPILTPSPVTLCHTSRDPLKCVTHFGFFVGQKFPDKDDLYKVLLNLAKPISKCVHVFMYMHVCKGLFV